MVSSKTVIATPPGATIKEQLVDRGMSQKEFAARMEMSEKHISKLINGEVQLTPDVALRLEMVLGVPAHFWINLESIYREKIKRAEYENNLEEDVEVSKKIPYNEMAKSGWVAPAKTTYDRVVNLRQFFEVVRLGLIDKPLVPNIACRKLGMSEKSDYALIAWAQKAKLDARGIYTAPINLDKLNDLLPNIRSMTMQDPSVFCDNLVQILSECGIALVFLPHIGGSFLHGATFYDGAKIVLGITVRGKDADRFWFSLFHELGHILLGHIGLPEGTSEEDECEADSFASNTLIPDSVFESYTSNVRIDRRSIIDFSSSIGIAPGIVVGRMQKEGIIPFSYYNDLKAKYVITP